MDTGRQSLVTEPPTFETSRLASSSDWPMMVTGVPVPKVDTLVRLIELASLGVPQKEVLLNP
jgi:hypothetical protein